MRARRGRRLAWRPYCVNFQGTVSAMDIREQQRTYEGFLRLATRISVASVMILAGMALFLV
ncbi:MAG: aa3-type cytochrome c oxidase subunit IV [Alphaproteobacteria bacterium]|nr:MAG: aa3-type cytochrome c oxidase subunit IV [Alphaproteobacteria bacterium]